MAGLRLNECSSKPFKTYDAAAWQRLGEAGAISDELPQKHENITFWTWYDSLFFRSFVLLSLGAFLCSIDRDLYSPHAAFWFVWLE